MAKSVYRHVAVRAEPFDSAAETAALLAAVGPCGALVSFVGQVRADDGVEELYLEHYPGMTERSLLAITHAAERHWPLQGLVLIHRIGALLPGEPIVLTITAGAHRKASYEANVYIMDSLKTDAIFWKREKRNVEGHSRTHWVESTGADLDAGQRWRRLLSGGESPSMKPGKAMHKGQIGGRMGGR